MARRKRVEDLADVKLIRASKPAATPAVMPMSRYEYVPAASLVPGRKLVDRPHDPKPAVSFAVAVLHGDKYATDAITPRSPRCVHVILGSEDKKGGRHTVCYHPNDRVCVIK